MLRISEHWAKMFMWSSYKIGVYGINIGLDIVRKTVEIFEGGFAMDCSEV